MHLKAKENCCKDEFRVFHQAKHGRRSDGREKRRRGRDQTCCKARADLATTPPVLNRVRSWRRTVVVVIGGSGPFEIQVEGGVVECVAEAGGGDGAVLGEGKLAVEDEGGCRQCIGVDEQR